MLWKKVEKYQDALARSGYRDFALLCGTVNVTMKAKVPSPRSTRFGHMFFVFEVLASSVRPKAASVGSSS
jgi:hypothetical protein